MASQDRGSFNNDRSRASEAGRKAGQATQSRSENQQGNQPSGKSGQQSAGNFANDPSRAAKAGRKDGEQSGGDRH